MAFTLHAGDIIACLAAGLLFVLIAGIKYPNRCVGTMDRPDLPGPPGYPIIGNMPLVFRHRKGMLGFLDLMQSIYGPLFTFTLPGWGRNIVINRPEWLEHMRKGDTTIYGKGQVVRDVFGQFPGSTTPISTDGTQWKYARRMMQPIFGAKAVNSHASQAMKEIIPITQDLLREVSKKNMAIDWNDLCSRLAVSIFCKMAFNMPTGLLTSDVNCLTASDTITDTLLTLSLITADRLFNPAWRITELFDGRRAQFARAKAQINVIVDDIVKMRKEDMAADPDAKQNADYLTALLSSAEDKETSAIRDTLITLLFAGRESTQNTISWMMYEITRNPEWIARLREEAEQQAAESGTFIPSYAQLQSYPIHLAVCYETLRLWPGLPKNAREAEADDVLPAIPELNLPAVRVYKGDFVLWSDMAMMRNSDVWGPDAAEFNPRRHLDSDGKFIKPPTPKFHSFGTGPRACPAMQLSIYEITSIFVALLWSFDFVPVNPGVRTSIDAFAPFMDGPFMVYVKERDGKA
ncbi:hypothetical protein NM688_g4661 [Phlebia brevispora]|uniref:Uncharacterized protein n=1 Tax=Phlebia brevispora TaxID=194682 RepID=A0ACC1T2A6_9APHY|nr:hypothetical protein NM688_g4661 [Phlebia brevispora]